MTTLKEAVTEKRENYLGSLQNLLTKARHDLSLLSLTVEKFPKDSFGMGLRVDELEKGIVRLAFYVTRLRELDELRYTAAGGAVSDFYDEPPVVDAVPGDSKDG